MVLDIREFRENPEAVRESQRRRFAPVEIVDQVIELDGQWRKARFNLDQASKELGQVNKEIGMLHKSKKSTGAAPTAEQAAESEKKMTELTARKAEIERRIVELTAQEDALRQQVATKVGTVGNLVHESVPVSNDEEKNGLIRTWGDAHTKPAPGPYHHHELLAMIDGADTERGAKVAGHRGYFLKGPGVRINMALINYGMQFLEQRGYTVVQTPYFMRRDCMARTAQLSDFDESLYKVDEGAAGAGLAAGDEKYLIATSEQPISAMHMQELLLPKDLPLRYGGFSTNFRKEAGAHGKDTWGIFRVHQFEKIEQFVITEPQKSWEMHEEMIRIAEEFYQSLGFSYRVVSIVSGALNNAAAKKYDLEAWFPGFNAYRELVSCSNCTDYQSRSLEVRLGSKKDDGTKRLFVHMLNSTLVATERCLCCLLENCQTKDGIRIPEPLRPFIGTDLIPFVKPCPKTPPAEKPAPAPAASATAAAPQQK